MENYADKIKPFMPLAPREFLGGAQAYSFFADAEFFSSGASALYRALALCGAKVLWLPYFFCPKLTASLKRIASIKFYEDLPTELSPRFDTLTPEDGDAVLAVDFFGLRGGALWGEWFAAHRKIISIADHSHAPFSRWSRVGLEDFKFASLRKSLPIPDGGFLKSKNIEAKAYIRRGSDLQPFAAQALSAAALDSMGLESQDKFYAAETLLIAGRKVSRISKYSLEVLHSLNLSEMAKRRFDNIKTFCDAVASSDSRDFKVLNFADGRNPEAFDLWYPVLEFADASARDKVYARLRDMGIFAAIYWGSMDKSASAVSRETSARMFVVPIDFRHTADDALQAALALSL